MARIDIRKFEPQNVTAPSLVWFEATGLEGFDTPEAPGQTYDPSFGGVTYVWTVEGPASAPERYTAPHLPDAWNRAHRAYGKTVAFVLTQADATYRIRLWAIDATGHVGEAETTVQTIAPVEAHPVTVCLDPSGRFAGAPDGATKVATVAAMQDALQGARRPARLLIARGQVIDDFLVKGSKTTLGYIGTFGDPAAPRPVLNAVPYAANMFEFEKTRQPQLTLAGLECRGDWDATTETGRQTNSPLDFGSRALGHFTVWDCRFSGFGTVEVSVSDETGWTGGFGNTEITNWSGYGTFIHRAPQARLAFVGCDIAQHPEALNHYPGGRNGLMITQGPMRIPECNTIYLGASSFLARGGWSGGNDQECLRLNSRCVPGSRYVIERCTLEGGTGIFKMSGSNARAVETPGNYLMDKVLMLSGGGKTGSFGRAHFGGTTIRNTLMVQLDVPSADDFPYRASLSLTPDQEEPGNLATPVALYNCAVMNLRGARSDPGDRPHLANTVAFQNYTEENNIVHAPDLVKYPEDRHAPITTDTGLTGFRPRYRGIQPNFAFETGVLARNVEDGESLRIPYPSGTDQAYWQSLPAGDTQHGIRVHKRAFFAAFGMFEVTFGRADITLTNTSGRLWEAEAKWTLRLDRASRLPAMDPGFGNPTEREVPLPVPAPGSPAISAGPPRGRHAYDDFLGQVRPGPSETGRDHTGAPRPTTGGTAGALHVG